ncbi:MAG: hypothetical protein AAFV88_12665, partial [Planctomycetota bacterium]
MSICRSLLVGCVVFSLLFQGDASAKTSGELKLATAVLSVDEGSDVALVKFQPAWPPGSDSKDEAVAREETYNVEVPYVEQVAQTYMVQVPYTVTRKTEDGKEVAETRMRAEQRTRLVPVKKLRVETRTRTIPAEKKMPPVKLADLKFSRIGGEEVTKKQLGDLFL